MPPGELVDVAIDRFLEVRNQKGLAKVPGTSEFLDWLRVLAQFGNQAPYPLETLRKATIGALPYRELLFKLRGDWRQSELSSSP
jgi:MoxR-like ATPase